MVTSKIILLLRKFDKRDFADFGEFLRSPYFNNKAKLVQFYNKLEKYYPDFNETKIKREKIYESLYPESTYNPQVYKNLSSELYIMAKEFLSVQNIKGKEIEKELYILNKLEHIKADELYKMELKSFRKKLNEISFDDFTFYNKFNLAALERTFYYNRSNFMKGSELNAEESDELLKFYFIHMFRQRFDMEVSKLNSNIVYEENAAMNYASSIIDKGILQETVNYMQSNNIKNNEIVAMFYYILMSLINLNNDSLFDKAKELVFRNMSRFESDVRFVVSSSLLTVCTFKINLRTAESDYKNAFEIIKFQLRMKIYKESDESYISVTEFRSIFMIGLYLKEYDWLKKFIKKYINEVAPEYRTSLYNLLHAHIKFHEKKYDEALDSVNKVKFEQHIYKQDVRKLQLLIYFELGHLESVLSLISSYKEFLNNNKNITEITKKSSFVFLHFISKLVKLNENFNDYDLLDLKSEVDKNPHAIYKDWLVEKINALEGKDL